MPQITRTTEDIQKVKESIEKTRDRFEREGHDRDDEGLALLDNFCDWLLARGYEGTRSAEDFLSGEDLEV